MYRLKLLIWKDRMNRLFVHFVQILFGDHMWRLMDIIYSCKDRTRIVKLIDWRSYRMNEKIVRVDHKCINLYNIVECTDDRMSADFFVWRAWKNRICKLYVQIICKCRMYTSYVQTVCTDRMYRSYVQIVCTDHM